MTYYFDKYRPSFFEGFEEEDDHIEFDTWEQLLEKYEKKYPLLDNYVYAYDKGTYRNRNWGIIERHSLMIVNKNGNDWWVIGFTNYPLEEVYPHWESLVNSFALKR